MDDFRKQSVMTGFFSASLAESDPALASAIGDELVRQQDQIEMIASEHMAIRFCFFIQRIFAAH